MRMMLGLPNLAVPVGGLPWGYLPYIGGFIYYSGYVPGLGQLFQVVLP